MRPGGDSGDFCAARRDWCRRLAGRVRRVQARSDGAEARDTPSAAERRSVPSPSTPLTSPTPHCSMPARPYDSLLPRGARAGAFPEGSRRLRSRLRRPPLPGQEPRLSPDGQQVADPRQHLRPVQHSAASPSRWAADPGHDVRARDGAHGALVAGRRPDRHCRRRWRGAIPGLRRSLRRRRAPTIHCSSCTTPKQSGFAARALAPHGCCSVYAGNERGAHSCRCIVRNDIHMARPGPSLLNDALNVPLMVARRARGDRAGRPE